MRLGKTEILFEILERIWVVAFCASPIFLLSASFVMARHGRPPIPLFWGLGLALAILGTAFGLLNFYLTFMRPRRYFARHKSWTDYQYVSPFPLFGTILVVLGVWSGFRALDIAIVGSVAMALDTGGTFWFLIYIARARLFWKLND